MIVYLMIFPLWKRNTHVHMHTHRHAAHTRARARTHTHTQCILTRMHANSDNSLLWCLQFEKSIVMVNKLKPIKWYLNTQTRGILSSVVLIQHNATSSIFCLKNTYLDIWNIHSFRYKDTHADTHTHTHTHTYTGHQN